MKERIRKLWLRVNELLRTQIWEPDITVVSNLRRWGYRQLRVGVLFASGVARGKVQLRASAMTFTTLLTLGPVLVLTMSLFRMFGALEGVRAQLEKLLIDYLSPGSQEQVRTWLVTFFDAVDRGAFRELSLVVLLGAVVGLLGSIETAFNDIWGVHRGRSIFSRLSIYTTLIFFSPILIALSLSVTASLETSALRAWLDMRAPAWETLLRIGLRLGPVFLTGLAFTLLYTILPNVRVSMRASLPAGLIAGLMWEGLKFGYGAYMRHASHYGTLYGSLAAVPFFLIWVYVSWLVVLFGAQLAFARDAAQDFRQEVWAASAGLRDRFRVGMHVALEVARRYREEQPPPDLIELAQRTRLPLRLVRAVAESLVEGGILHQVSSDRRELLLVPARAPERITVYDVFASLAGNPKDVGTGLDPTSPETGEAGEETEAPAPHDRSAVDLLVDDVDRSIRERWDVRSLTDVLDELAQSAQQEIFPFSVLDGRGWTRGPKEGN
jgi:membrane protein